MPGTGPGAVGERTRVCVAPPSDDGRRSGPVAMRKIRVLELKLGAADGAAERLIECVAEVGVSQCSGRIDACGRVEA